MRILYIFPHPDDESFGPGPALAKQRREGHEVFLLTLTKGGATRQRHRYGYSIEEMGEVRYREMLNVEKTLDLSGMRVLDFPDSGLKEVDPRDVEAAIEEEIRDRKPDVVVTYAVHGISGFHDHLIGHGIVKRVFCVLREELPNLRRLALLTTSEEAAKNATLFKLSHSTAAEIDCAVEVSDDDVDRGQKALDCYETFQVTIEASGVRDHITGPTVFEFFQEEFDPPVGDVFEEL
ncbi:MAG: PIG-L family deacetylase [Planctomycetota bacterium]